MRRRESHGRAREHDRERGSASVELVLIAPVLAAIVLLLVVGGRLAIAGNAVESAAAAAARDASLARSSAEAEVRASEAAVLFLDQAGLDCASLTVAVDASALDTVLGGTGDVTASIECVVGLADVALPGLGGSRTIDATASSPIDPYRERR